MDTTRRFWAVIGVGSLLAVLGVLARAPLLLFGTAGVGAWVVAAQVDTLRSFLDTKRSLSVSVETDREQVLEGNALLVTATATLDAPTATSVTVPIPVPPSVRGPREADRTLHLDAGETRAERSFTVQTDTVGQVGFDSPTATFDGPWGLFRETLVCGSQKTVLVDPPVPRDVHVGQGGEHISAAFGEHEGGEFGVGLDPAELREYIPGDPLSRVDWNATARHRMPYVREYESESDTELALVVYHGSDMDLGEPGQTMLDYAKEVALGLAGVAESHADPLSLYAVDDRGITDRHMATTIREGYRRIRQYVRTLEAGAPSDDGVPDTPGTLVRPVTARTLRDRLDDSEDPYDSLLRPFLDATASYVTRIEGNPLFETVRVVRSQSNARVQTVIVTDDGDRSGVYEAARFAAKDDGGALVFLTPRGLFEPAGLADLETAYDRYRDFEEFRRRLDALPNVTAYEVAPGDRLHALLAARTPQQHEQS